MSSVDDVGLGLRAEGVRVVLDGTTIIDDVSFRIEPGSHVGLVGPNGSGKSTLLRVLYRSLKASQGTVWLGDDELSTLTMRETALRRSGVSQDNQLDGDYTVRELVEMGRDPHHRLLGRLSETDRSAVDEALDSVGLPWAAERSVLTLSGGERQRALIARALAQGAQIMLLDEPTNHLDIASRLQILELLAGLPLTVFVALHELEHALAYCDHAVLMDHGRIVDAGPIHRVLSISAISAVFGVDARIIEHPITNRPHLVYARRSKEAR